MPLECVPLALLKKPLLREKQRASEKEGEGERRVVQAVLRATTGHQGPPVSRAHGHLVGIVELGTGQGAKGHSGSERTRDAIDVAVSL